MRLGFGLSKHNPHKQTPLRTIAVNNRMNDFSEHNASYKNYFFRTPYMIGQDSTDIVILLLGWGFGSSGYSDAQNPVTIVDMSLESPSGTVIPITFSGSRSVTIGITDEIFADTILPASFSLTKFSKSSTNLWWIKGRVSTDNLGGVVQLNNNYQRGDVANNQTAFYDPGATTLSSTDTSGPYTTTGAGAFLRAACFVPIMLGHPVVDSPSWLMVGDSIGGGFADGPNGAYGRSFFNRALQGDGTNVLPGLNLSVGGTNPGHFMNEPHVMGLYKYARFAAENHAANEMSSVTLAVAKTDHLTLWSNFRSNGIQKVVAVEPFARTTSTDGFLTAANQSYATTPWSPGNVVDQYEAWLQTQIGVTINAVAQTDIARDPTETRKWKSDGVADDYTSDGLHPRTQPNIDVGGLLATVMRGIL